MGSLLDRDLNEADLLDRLEDIEGWIRDLQEYALETDADGTIGTALTDHEHSAADGDGGQLDWDVIWLDGVHDHSGAAEGGALVIGTTDTDGAAGSVLFLGTDGVLQQDNANLFWDDTNNRLGVGTNTPSSPFHVYGTASGAMALFYNTNSGALNLTLRLPTGSDVSTGRALAIQSTAESYSRLVMYTQAWIGFGDGSATRDTFITRPGANTLRVSSDAATGAADLDVRGDMYVYGGASIGPDATAPVYTFEVRENQNAFTRAMVYNTTSGTAARVGFGANSDAAGLSLTVFSSGYTTSGINIPDSVLLYANASATAGLSLATGAAAPIRFYPNSVLSVTIPSGGGLTVDAGSLTVTSGNVDLNGGDLVLDADADSILHCYADDAFAIELGGSEVLRLVSTKLLLNETSNGDMTTGLTLNQGAADDHILSLKSSDVAHGFTDWAETDTYGFFRKLSGTLGGLNIVGIIETGTSTGLYLDGASPTDNTAKTSSAAGRIHLRGVKYSGTSAVANATDQNLVTIGNATYSRFIFDNEGSAHAEVEWTTFDEYDDVALLGDLETAMLTHKDPIKARFVEFMKYNKADLQEARLVNFYEENGRRGAMVNFTRLTMAMVGALRQLGERLQRYDRALLSLGVDPTLLE